MFTKKKKKKKRDFTDDLIKAMFAFRHEENKPKVGTMTTDGSRYV